MPSTMQKSKHTKFSHLEMLLENVICTAYVKQIRFTNTMFQTQLTNTKSKIKYLSSSQTAMRSATTSTNRSETVATKFLKNYEVLLS